MLKHNNITRVDLSSFKRYTKLMVIDISFNALSMIGNETFDSNRRLLVIKYECCAIESAPVYFGPCAANMRPMNFNHGIVNSNV